MSVMMKPSGVNEGDWRRSVTLFEFGLLALKALVHACFQTEHTIYGTVETFNTVNICQTSPKRLNFTKKTHLKTAWFGLLLGDMV